MGFQVRVSDHLTVVFWTGEADLVAKRWTSNSFMTGWEFALADPVAVALDHGYVGMMQQPIQQRDGARRVGKDLVPILERPVWL